MFRIAWLRKWLSAPRTTRRDRRLRAGRLSMEALEARTVPTGFWQTLNPTNPAAGPAGTQAVVLLSDGTVAVQGGVNDTSTTWFRLTPDATGSYVTGTWSSLASMNVGRLFFTSAVLPSGKVFAVGGEYSTPFDFTNTAEVYDPVANTWTSVASVPTPNTQVGSNPPPAPTSQFGDDPIAVLPDGQVLAGYFNSGTTYRYNPTTNTWTTTAGGKLRGDASDEETWVKLPDGSVLSYDIFASVSAGGFRAQRYVPATDSWVDASAVNAANPPAVLSGNGQGFELGPAFLEQDLNHVFYFGANGNTAVYNISTGLWSAGPKEPTKLIGGVTTPMVATDDPGAMLPNGHILITLSPLGTNPGSGYTFPDPTYVYEFDPTAGTFTEVTPPGLTVNAYSLNMLVLPTGQVMLCNENGPVQIYTPDGSPPAAAQPTVTKIVHDGTGTFTLTGTGLNGISEGASYGDDNASATNYPIVRLLDTAGNVHFARTFNWSSTGVATGADVVTTNFTLPAGLSLSQVANFEVVANGIASAGTDAPLVLDASTPNVTVRVDPTDSTNVQVLSNGVVIRNYPNGSANPIAIVGDVNANAVTVDSSNGLVNAPITFDGGGGLNSLLLTQTGGATQTSDLYSPGPNPGEGTSVITGASGTQRVTFQNLAPVLDNVPATTATVNGDNGDNAINYAQGPGGGIFTGNTGFVTVDNQESFEFNNKTNLVINALAGSDTINLGNTTVPAGLTGTITVNGGDPTAGGDTLIVNGLVNATDSFTYTPATSSSDTGSMADTGLPTVNFTTIEQLVIDGRNGGPGGAGDSLTVNTGNLSSNQTEILTPGTTFDSGHVDFRDRPGGVNPTAVPLDFRALGVAGSLSFNDVGRFDNLVYNGTARNDTYTVSATGVVNLNSQIPVNTSSIITLTLAGLDGDDTFNVAGNHNLPGGVAVQGGDTSAGDVLNFTGNGAGAVTADLAAQTVTEAGFAAVSFSGVEVVNVNAGGAALTVNATAGNDSLTYTPTGAQAGTVALAGLNTAFNFNNATDTFTLDAGGGSDTVTVNGTGAGDTIAVVKGATTTVQVGGLKTVSLPSANDETVTIAAGDGNDFINVSGTTNSGQIVNVNGGDPTSNNGAASDTLTVTTSTAGTTAVNPGSTPDAGSITSPDGTTEFSGIEFVTLTGTAAGANTVTANGGNGNNNIALQFLGGANRFWVDNRAVVSFSNFQTVNLNGQFGDNTYRVSPVGLIGVTTITVTDTTLGAGTLQVNGSAAADAIGYNPTGAVSGDVTIAGSAPVVFSNITGVAVNGQGGGDSLTVATLDGSDAVTLTPGAAIDAGLVTITGTASLPSAPPLSYANLSSGGSLTFASGAVGARSDTLVYNGTAGRDAFGVAASGDVTLNLQLVVHTPGVANLTLQGLDGDDVFNVAGGLPFTGTVLDGGNPSASDAANLTGPTGPVAVNLAGAMPATDTTVAGYGGVLTLVGVEVANVNAGGGGLTVNGTAGDDALTYTPTGAAAGTVALAGLNTLINFTGSGTTFTLDPLGGSDAVTVNGTAGGETITVAAAGANTTVQVGALKSVTLPTASTEALAVACGGGDDTLAVTAGGGIVFGGTPITFDGGPGTDTVRLVGTAGANDAFTYTPGVNAAAGRVAVTGGATAAVDFTQAERVAVDGGGGGGADTLTLTGTGGPDVFAVAADDSVVPLANTGTAWVNGGPAIGFGDFGSASSTGAATAVVIAAGTGTDTFQLTGTSQPDAFTFAPGTRLLSVATGAAVTQYATASAEVVGLDGAAPTTAPGDTLTVTTALLGTVPLPFGTLTGSGLTLDYQNMEGVVDVAVPVAVDDANTAAGNGPALPRLLEDSSVVLDILANDTFAAGNGPGGAVVLITSLPANGAVQILAATDPTNPTAVNPTTARQVVRYTPNPNFFGTDTFAYVPVDARGQAAATAATVTVTVIPVNDAPSFTLINTPVVVAEDDTGAVHTAQVAANVSVGPATEAAAGQTVAFVVSNSNPALFAVQPAISPTGLLTYTLNPDQNGSATVTVFLQDDGGTADGGADTSPTAQFVLTVTPVNDAPILTPAPNVVTTEDTPAAVPGIAVGDVDATVPVVTDFAVTVTLALAQPAIGTLTAQPASGVTVGGSGTANLSITGPRTLVNAALGSVVYTPNPNRNGTDTITVTVDDHGNIGGGNLTAADTIQVTVTPVNDTPAVTGTAAATAEDTAVDIDLKPLVTDIETAAGAMTYNLGGATNGTVAYLGNGVVRFTPTANYSGPAGFTYSVTDTGDGAAPPATSNTATVAVTVTPVADAPTLAVTSPVVGDEGAAIPLTINAALTDPSETLTVSITGFPAGTVFSAGVNNGTTVELTPAQLTGLTVTFPDGAVGGTAYNLQVTATSAESDGSTATTPVAPATNLVVTVTNVDPTATLGNGGPVDEGSTGTVSFSNQADPAQADVVAGLRYSYDFDNDGTFDLGNGTFAGSVTSATAAVPAGFLADGPGTRTVRARVVDKDGGFTDYTTDVTILNVAPTAAFGVGSPLVPGQPATVSFTNPSDPSAADVAAGFTYQFDLGTGVFGPAGPSPTATFTPPAPGTYTIRGRITDKDGGVTEYTATTGVGAAAGQVVVPNVDMYAVGAGPGGGPIVKVYRASDNALVTTLVAYEPGFRGGVNVAMADVTGDGIPDVITGTGVGGGPVVKVFDGATFAQVVSFFAYEPTFRGGVTVAAGDVTGTGVGSIVTGSGVGGGPVVKVFSAAGALQGSFLAYDPSQRGGVNVGVAQLAAAGPASIVTGAGVGGAPHVKTFTVTGVEQLSFFAYDPSFTGGVTVSGGRLSGSGTGSIVTGTGLGGGPILRIFDGLTGALQVSTPAFGPDAYGRSLRDGFTVNAAHVGGAAGESRIIVGAGPNYGPTVRVLDGANLEQVIELAPYEEGFDGGVYVG